MVVSNTKPTGTPEHDAISQKALEARTKLANYIGNTPWVDANKDNPSAIQVTFWVQAEEASGLTAFTTTIDPANGTFTFPVQDDEAVFPTAS